MVNLVAVQIGVTFRIVWVLWRVGDGQPCCCSDWCYVQNSVGLLYLIRSHLRVIITPTYTHTYTLLV